MGVLDGVRVLDLATLWAVPLTATYLADQGAEVIKIEPPWGDEARRLYTLPPIRGGEGRTFQVSGRGKRSVVLDLTRPEGREVLYRLVDRADVLLHNYRPAVAQRLGVDYETLCARNPRLIYVTITAYGDRGPYAGQRGYDVLAQALSGLMGRRSLPDGTPLGAGVWVSDMSAPMCLAYGIALALYHRERTGRGQKVETSLLHMCLAMQLVDLIRVEHGEEGGGSGGPRDYFNLAVWAPYRCADGRWLRIAAVSDREFQDLCRALDLEHLAQDPRFATGRARLDSNEDLYNLLEGVFATRPRDEWLEVLRRHDVPCAPVLSPEEVFDHPQVRENGMVAEVEHPLAGRVTFVAPPVRLSGAPPRVQGPAPLLGQHTEEVLREVGYSEEEIARLRQARVIAG